MDFASSLRQLRQKAGFDKARGFHSQLVEDGVEINYAYYMKMEAGQVLPSHKVVEQISQCLDDEEAAQLILSYCRTLFPRKKHLFPASKNSLKQITPTASLDSQVSPVKGQGRELNRRQVHVLARSKVHYHLFLMASLARQDLPLEEIRQVFQPKNVDAAIADLEAAKILRIQKNGIRTLAGEHQFPSAKDFSELRPIYRQFDEWDESFAEDFEFESRINKMLIRRISPRYLNIIEKSLETVLSLVRASDELDTRHNEDLIQVRLSLRSGKLPG